ncbi:FRG domain-containing protein [Enterobacter bugandensis]|uniref:FRG domain-containing protein n=1 Tax=Enterobacter bugandensis TaxID=881260 RepID=UPI00283AB20E|nr:FRG domain-containing protein [Enterobacter bugandensis]WMU74320.1 FRG domain-containing protein [Enterobacter bugandensis]
MKIFETELFGPVVAPDEFWQIIELASLGECETKNIYLWRGQGNIAWPIHSSAYRRLEKDKTYPPSEITMRDYESELLLNAKHQGYHHEKGRTLADFELLAKLQHHGAATRLVDFSRNMLVALWFACNSESDKTGLLFGMYWAGVSGFEGRPEHRTYNELFGSGAPKADDELENFSRLWQPPVVTRRIAAQSAQFLYSRVADERTGSLVLCENPNHLNMIAITPELKKKCLVLLESVFDIRQFTLFPDIDGFCYANSVSFESHSNERW